MMQCTHINPKVLFNAKILIPNLKMCIYFSDSMAS